MQKKPVAVKFKIPAPKFPTVCGNKMPTRCNR